MGSLLTLVQRSFPKEVRKTASFTPGTGLNKVSQLTQRDSQRQQRLGPGHATTRAPGTPEGRQGGQKWGFGGASVSGVPRLLLPNAPRPPSPGAGAGPWAVPTVLTACRGRERAGPASRRAWRACSPPSPRRCGQTRWRRPRKGRGARSPPAAPCRSRKGRGWSRGMASTSQRRSTSPRPYSAGPPRGPRCDHPCWPGAARWTHPSCCTAGPHGHRFGRACGCEPSAPRPRPRTAARWHLPCLSACFLTKHHTATLLPPAPPPMVLPPLYSARHRSGPPSALRPAQPGRRGPFPCSSELPAGFQRSKYSWACPTCNKFKQQSRAPGPLASGSPPLPWGSHHKVWSVLAINFLLSDVRHFFFCSMENYLNSGYKRNCLCPR